MLQPEKLMMIKATGIQGLCGQLLSGNDTVIRDYVQFVFSTLEMETARTASMSI